jgi:DNA-3-methyladenine glycosylase
VRPRRLRRSGLPAPSSALARFLIGKVLVRELRSGRRLAGRIVETEAYLPGDAACHAFGGRTERNASLFLRHGHAYVYFCYGVHWMMNVSSEKEGVGGGVLLRALEPLEGFVGKAAVGPGRLAKTMKIDRSLDGVDLCGPGPLWLAETGRGPAVRVGISTRIGIVKDAHRPLRFFEAGNPFLSGPRSLNYP